MREVAVIMAGGSGTRLWPLSRRARPKQLLRIVEGRSLIDLAYERIRSAFAAEDIYVIALADHLPAIAKELPDLPEANLIGEPTGRDTAAAIGLAAAILHRRDPETVMGVFTADHLIRPADVFATIVRRGMAAAVAYPEALVTFGIKPTEAHTGLGYVERGGSVTSGVWAVGSFKEKPDLETARGYVASGDYYWNSGMFAWRTAAILGRLERHLPGTHGAALDLAVGCGTEDGFRRAREVYPSLERISIDFAVMEKAAAETSESSPSVLVVEMDLEWLDVGNWTALPEVLGADDAGNVLSLERSALLDGRNNILVSEDDHLIGVIGVEDLVIVHSRDATLVCHKDQVQRIKELVGRLEDGHKGRYS